MRPLDAERPPVGAPGAAVPSDRERTPIKGKRSPLPHTRDVLYRVRWRYPRWPEGQWCTRYMGYRGMLAQKARLAKYDAEVRVEASTVRTVDMGWRQYPGPNAPKGKKVDGAT